MRKISLTQGKIAFVDDGDFEWLSRFKWHAERSKYTWYASREAGKIKTRMHRLILGLIYGDGKDTDHIDSNGLNNQRSNLRICSHQENLCNQRLQKREKSSRFKGVCWDKERGKWYASIGINGKNNHIGRFDNEIGAANAYNQAALEHFGEFALLNKFKGNPK